jgi:cell division septum initiation protein DivIVA
MTPKQTPKQTPEQSPSTVDKAAERLAAVLDAAERAALDVIDDAEREAQRYLEDAQARADRIVAEQLREAADRLEGQAAPNGGAPMLRPVEAEPGEVGAEPDASRGGGSAAARLLATQMAVSGKSRAEIEMRLRNGFDIEDTREILDAILGPEE